VTQVRRFRLSEFFSAYKGVVRVLKITNFCPGGKCAVLRLFPCDLTFGGMA